MIKVIALDFVWVLVREKAIKLSEIESSIEKRFWPIISDELFFQEFENLWLSREKFSQIIINIVNKLYEVRDPNLFENIVNQFPDAKICIATNHISYICDYIEKYFWDKVDHCFISAELHKVKPNKNFYEEILQYYGITPDELLFLDDSDENIKWASALGIKVLKVERNTRLFEN